VPNPTFDPIIVPGCNDLMFRGQIPDGVDPRSLMKVEPLRPEYQDRDLRVAKMDEQDLDAVFMFPTLGCGVEQVLRFDVPATMATLRAYNRWLEEDWGYSYRDRIVTAPMISLADPDAAIEEIDHVVGRGARLVHVRPAPVPDGHGRGYSLGHERHDPVWARLAEASVPAAFHLGDSGYEAFLGAAWGGQDRFEPFRGIEPLTKLVVSDRPIHDTIGSLVVHGVFDRHPGLRVASIENGSDWVHTLVKRLRKQANQTPWVFADDPLDTIRGHVWITPYYEEDMRRLADLIGVERVLFGSDWPHGEGLARPTDFVKELHDFSDAEIHKVMRDNALDLLGVEALA
jgi:predicted TIM-barrel fold metal-dependent hydrolase